MPHSNDATGARTEGELARLCEEISDRVRSGAGVDIEEYTARWPQYADELQQVLPAIEMMTGLKPIPIPTVTGSGEELAEAGEALGDFRLLREIGRGGMGVVYEAQQLSLRRRVAIKVLPFASVLDGRQLRRFQNEAQAAALLHHPRIVPVHGVGCDRGVHYYAMQLIDGPTLADVIGDLRMHAGLDQPPASSAETSPRTDRDQADKDDLVHRGAVAPAAIPDPGQPKRVGSPGTTANLGILSTSRSHRSSSFIRAAAQLGVDVAEALDYAHQEGVLHRDIKPGNLLLGERGQVWVTDFGLARIEADPGMTLTGDLVGTLRYMSPEQALANRVAIDGRTDVYALGATLYELLTLRPVFDGTDKQTLLRQIAFEEPRPPRQLERGLPFELETILLKTLAKDPVERYATAGALADDLQRFLEQKPISARRPSLVDWLGKWAQRNRRSVAASAIGLLLTAMTFAVASLLIWNEQHKTREALGIAIAERNEAKRLQEEADQQRQQAVAEQLRADRQTSIARELSAFLRDDLLGQAAVANQNSQDGARDPELQVRTLLDRASEEIEERFTDEPLLEAEIRQTIGNTYRALGLLEEAERHLRRAWDLHREQLGADHSDTLLSLTHLALLYGEQARYAEAEPLIAQILDSLLRSLGPDHPDTLAMIHNHTWVLMSLGRCAEAEPLLAQVLETSQRVLGAEHPDTLRSMLNLAECYRAIGSWEKAVAIQERAVELLRRVLGPDHPDTMASMNNLALAYLAAGQYELAWQSGEMTLAIERKILGPHHPHTLVSMANHAEACLRTGRHEQAMELSQQSYQVSTIELGAEHPTTLKSLASLVQAYHASGQWGRALPLAEEALRLRTQVLGPKHPQTLSAACALANTYRETNQLSAARSLCEQTLQTAFETLGPQHHLTLIIKSNLAMILDRAGEREQARGLFYESAELMKVALGPTHPVTLETLHNLAVTCREIGQSENGEAYNYCGEVGKTGSGPAAAR